MRVPQEPGRPLSFHLHPVRDAGHSNPRSTAIRPRQPWKQIAGKVGTGTQVQAKRTGMTARESEHLHSTVEAGELSPGDPTEGRRMSGHWTRWRERPWEHRIPVKSQRNCSG